MATAGPVFNQVNLVVGDIEASLEFYRRLGLAVEAGPEWPAGSGGRHAEVKMPDGVTLEWDNAPFGLVWAPQWRAARGPVVGFSVGTSDDVDRSFAELVGAGYEGLQEPYDAFWGARYAIVADPDGNAVGLMGPLGDRPRYVPEGGGDG